MNLLYTLGFVTLALFLVQAVTGTILALYYSPSPDHAYDSIEYVMTQVSSDRLSAGSTTGAPAPWSSRCCCTRW